MDIFSHIERNSEKRRREREDLEKRQGDTERERTWRRDRERVVENGGTDPRAKKSTKIFGNKYNC